MQILYNFFSLEKVFLASFFSLLYTALSFKNLSTQINPRNVFPKGQDELILFIFRLFNLTKTLEWLVLRFYC